MSPKMKIDGSRLVSDFFHEKYFIAINSPLNFSDFISHLYASLGMKFKMIDQKISLLQATASNPSSLFTPEKETGHSAVDFLVFKMTSKQSQVEHTLYQNKSNQQILLPTLKTFDYIFMIENANQAEIYCQNLITKLQSIEQVIYSQIIDIEPVKEKARLVL